MQKVYDTVRQYKLNLKKYKENSGNYAFYWDKNILTIENHKEEDILNDIIIDIAPFTWGGVDYKKDKYLTTFIMDYNFDDDVLYYISFLLKTKYKYNK